jgi:glyoxylase-like metal-dependent hydrolase (beta-lactamase superfamily II)
VIPLEDNFNDILGKAQRGLGLSDSELAQRAGVSAADVTAARAGKFDEGVVRKFAPPLHLSAEALVASGRKSWYPEPRELTGLAMFNTPYDDMTVNSFLIWELKSRAAAAFDTGSNCGPELKFAKEHGLGLKFIFLTHTHGDHVFDLERFKEATGAEALVSRLEAIVGARTFSPGDQFRIDDLRIETRLTSGHSRGGTTYVIIGLAKPVAVVGDAMFAGSMGGGMVSYDDALRNNREQILTLPDETILCCGHGPLTTVGEEKRHNPFFADQ